MIKHLGILLPLHSVCTLSCWSVWEALLYLLVLVVLVVLVSDAAGVLSSIFTGKYVKQNTKQRRQLSGCVELSNPSVTCKYRHTHTQSVSHSSFIQRNAVAVCVCVCVCVSGRPASQPRFTAGTQQPYQWAGLALAPRHSHTNEASANCSAPASLMGLICICATPPSYQRERCRR